MATETTEAEKALQGKVNTLTAENKTLKDQAKKDEAEIKKLKDSDTKNTKIIGDLKEKNSASAEELKNSKQEFEEYKTAHESAVKELDDLTVQKRQEVQGMMQKRTAAQERSKEFFKFIEETLK